MIRGMGEQLSRDEVNEMVREADLDGDGKVSFRGQCNVILWYLLRYEKGQ